MVEKALEVSEGRRDFIFKSESEKDKVEEDISSLEGLPLKEGYSRVIEGYNDKRLGDRDSARYIMTDFPKEVNRETPFISREFEIDSENRLIQRGYIEWIIEENSITHLESDYTRKDKEHWI